MTNIRIIAPSCTIIYAGCVCTDLLCTTVSDGTLRVGILPSYEVSQMAGEVKIVINDGCIEHISEVARAVVYLDHVDVYVTPPPLTHTHSARTLIQINTPRALATLYDDGTQHLMLEGNSFFVMDVPTLATYRLTHHSLSCGENITLRGTLIDGDEYLVTLIYRDKWHILHELRASRIRVTREGIETVDIVEDMLLHEVKTVYHADQVKRYFRATSPHRYVESMTGYLFLEAVMLGADEEARVYLSTSVDNMYTDILSLLGEYDTIESYQGKIALYDSRQTIAYPRLYDIDIVSGRITNVTCHR
ncbi:MAG: hypothetical protein IKD20_02850 [Clostridia bacterium]|nr:hypothetical protein [Clostridia bacterium]